MTVDSQRIFVRNTITVNAPVAHVFAVFTERQDTWWPRPHHIGTCQRFTAVLEPRVGGRWYERGDDGSECDWGRVLVWEPPHRVEAAATSAQPSSDIPACSARRRRVGCARSRHRMWAEV